MVRDQRAQLLKKLKDIEIVHEARTIKATLQVCMVVVENVMKNSRV